MKSPRRRLVPLPLRDVEIDGPFWSPRVQTNREVTIPAVYEEYKRTGRIGAFRLRWKPGRPRQPHVFWDSDVAKWLEGLCSTLVTHPDAARRRLADRTARLIASAQQPDGYLNTHYTVVEPDARWGNLRDRHELYCAGHLMEAAVAHRQATGSMVLLDALCRYADLIDRAFGRGRGKQRGYPGHEEIELALVRLWRATGQRRYLNLAKYFIDERGREPHYFRLEAERRGEPSGPFMPGHFINRQAHRPVREQTEAVGHAVRAMYLYSGMADVAAETGDAALCAACRRLWRSATERKMYVTGGVGARHQGEAFGDDWELPNAGAYAETCAAIGLVFFAHRMLQADGDGRYADVMERALYNGALSGVSLDGRRFFYVNPLASDGSHHRREAFACSCCPPNVVRLLASLGAYVYSRDDRALWVHLYLGGTATATLAGQPVTLTVATRYPWDGDVRATVATEKPVTFSLMLRVPGWCRRHTLRVNGRPVAARVSKGYARIRRRWSDGDRVDLSLAMPVERVAAHPLVEADAGKVALQRGPVVYCLEGCDHPVDVRRIALADRSRLTARFDPRLLGGTVVI